MAGDLNKNYLKLLNPGRVPDVNFIYINEISIQYITLKMKMEDYPRICECVNLALPAETVVYSAGNADRPDIHTSQCFLPDFRRAQ